ncbi:hypothetical protein [Streptomyces sp. NPDC088910]|uniref:hypothetical protein n=1 Tax=Streptomyces sp. NPDC088910 TaxID=3365911 RepID=UPI0037FAC99F
MSQAVYPHAPDISVPGGAGAGVGVGEGPVVDHRVGELDWVDIPLGALWRAALAGRGPVHGAARTGMSLGAVAVRDRAGYVAAGTFAGVSAGVGVGGGA